MGAACACGPSNSVAHPQEAYQPRIKADDPARPSGNCRLIRLTGFTLLLGLACIPLVQTWADAPVCVARVEGELDWPLHSWRDAPGGLLLTSHDLLRHYDRRCGTEEGEPDGEVDA